MQLFFKMQQQTTVVQNLLKYFKTQVDYSKLYITQTLQVIHFTLQVIL